MLIASGVTWPRPWSDGLAPLHRPAPVRAADHGSLQTIAAQDFVARHRHGKLDRPKAAEAEHLPGPSLPKGETGRVRTDGANAKLNRRALAAAPIPPEEA